MFFIQGNIALETVVKERDFYKQQMEFFQQQYNDAKAQGFPKPTAGLPSTGFHFQGSTRPSSGQISPSGTARSGRHTPDALSRVILNFDLYNSLYIGLQCQLPEVI